MALRAIAGVLDAAKLSVVDWSRCYARVLTSPPVTILHSSTLNMMPLFSVSPSHLAVLSWWRRDRLVQCLVYLRDAVDAATPVDTPGKRSERSDHVALLAGCQYKHRLCNLRAQAAAMPGFPPFMSLFLLCQWLMRPPYKRRDIPDDPSTDTFSARRWNLRTCWWCSASRTLKRLLTVLL